MAFVGDDELLYRRIPYQIEQSFFYSRSPDGVVRVSSSAFADRNRRISVDRAQLRDFDPAKTQLTDNDGIVELLTKTVRALSVSTNDKDGRPFLQHLLDVLPAPLPENVAHAEIIADPEIVKDSTFRRLREQLARLAEWVIYPADCRS
jgi:hypothetical protein